MPAGFFITTENPRTMRLTPGPVKRLNFGAAIANVIDIGLLSEAFVPGTTDPTVALRDRITWLVLRIRAAC